MISRNRESVFEAVPTLAKAKTAPARIPARQTLLSFVDSQPNYSRKYAGTTVIADIGNAERSRR